MTRQMAPGVSCSITWSPSANPFSQNAFHYRICPDWAIRKSLRIRVHGKSACCRKHPTPFPICQLLARFYCIKLATRRSSSDYTQNSISEKSYLPLPWALCGLVFRRFLTILKPEDGFCHQPQKPFRMSLPLSTWWADPALGPDQPGHSNQEAWARGEGGPHLPTAPHPRLPPGQALQA